MVAWVSELGFRLQKFHKYCVTYTAAKMDPVNDRWTFAG